MPLIYVIGDENSAKTQTVLQSGLDPELLVGNVFQDGLIVPTHWPISGWQGTTSSSKPAVRCCGNPGLDKACQSHHSRTPRLCFLF